MNRKDNDMTEARFAALLESYGAEPDRWPASERAAGIACSRASLGAGAALERAAALDALLDSGAPDTTVSDELAERIYALAPSGQPNCVPTDNVIPFWRRMLPATGNGWQKIAATAVLGIAAGVLFSEVRHDGAGAPIATAAITMPLTTVAVADSGANIGDGVALGSLAPQTPAPQTLSLQSDMASLSFTGSEDPLLGSNGADFSGSDDVEVSLADLPLL